MSKEQLRCAEEDRGVLLFRRRALDVAVVVQCASRFRKRVIDVVHVSEFKIRLQCNAAGICIHQT